MDLLKVRLRHSCECSRESLVLGRIAGFIGSGMQSRLNELELCLSLMFF